MKRIILVLVIVLSVGACSDDKSTAPEPVETSFRVGALNVELFYLYHPYLQLWAWELHATYKYEIEGSPGKIYTHWLYFEEADIDIVKDDFGADDCCEPADVEMDKYLTGLMLNDYFAGLDSVTVQFSLQGVFQDCSEGTADSIGAITWSDTVRARVIDPC